MNSVKEIVLLLGFVLFILIVGEVRSDAGSNIDMAFNSLSRAEKTAFQSAFGGDFFKSLKEVANCVEKEVFPIDLCNFGTSFDPFYYINKCGNGSVVLQVIADLFKNIPQKEIPFGIPPKVSKERCFDPLSSIIPTIEPPISISPPVISPRPFEL